MATIGTLGVSVILNCAVFDRKMRMSSRSVTAFSGQMKSLAVTFLSVAAAASALRRIGTEIKAAERTAADFEQQMAMVSTMLDRQNKSILPTYSAAMQKMSVRFGEGTDTISKGLYDILSASVAPKKALDVLTVSVKAAKAGFTTTAIAADAITTVLNSYNLEAERATDVSHKLFAIVKRGKTTFEELAPNIGKVASLANTAGVSFDELGATIATLTRVSSTTI